MNTGVVTAFIPLPVKHLTSGQYHDLAVDLVAGADDAGAKVMTFMDDKLGDLWAYNLCTGRQPDTPVPPDRYPSAEVNIMSHIVQHNRTAWALRAAKSYPEIDRWVWLDYGVMKQGGWGQLHPKMTRESLTRFLRKVATTTEIPDIIPFPGIEGKGPVYQRCNNWRFCGSTHIWPAKHLPAIDKAYRRELEAWIDLHGMVPLDLPIWALVEKNNPELPFRWYQGEYDATQWDNYPYGSAE